MKRLILATCAALISTTASADVFCNNLGCADFPGVSRVAIYTRQVIGASIYAGAAGYLAYQLWDTYYVHEVLHRRRTFCDLQGRILCDPARSPPLLFYTEPPPQTHGP